MAKNTFLRYAWLVDLLSNVGEASFEEISEAWEDDGLLNPGGEPLSKDTFNKHKRALSEYFGIELGCRTIVKESKAEDVSVEEVPSYHRRYEGPNQERQRRHREHLYQTQTIYKYFIKKEKDDRLGKRTRSLISALLQNAQVERNAPLRSKVLFEEETGLYTYKTTQIINAINKERKVVLLYQKYGKGEEVRERTLEPLGLKLFKRRWYMLAKEGKELKVFALDDRTKSIKVTKDGFVYPGNFDPANYFDKAFGTVKGEPELIRVKTYGLETDYWRSSPMHPSQKEVETREESGNDYSVFELKMYPYAFEFKQELFSRIDQIEVLAPQKLRDEMLLYIDKVKAIYLSSH